MGKLFGLFIKQSKSVPDPPPSVKNGFSKCGTAILAVVHGLQARVICYLFEGLFEETVAGEF